MSSVVKLIGAILFSLSLVIGSPSALADSACAIYPTRGLIRVHVPARGTIERKSILEAARQDLMDRHAVDVIFTVRYLKANLAWAYLHALPKLTNGEGQLEDVNILMKRDGHCWEAAGYVTMNDPDEPFSTALARLRSEFPEAPAAIFPQ